MPTAGAAAKGGVLRAIGAGLCLFAFLCASAAPTPEETTQLIKRADAIKISDHPQFKIAMDALKSQSIRFTDAQREHFAYLEGWQFAYDGDYEAAIVTLKDVLDQSKDANIRFRARATIVNVLSIAKRHEDALANLGHLLELLPRMSDPDAREQALAVAARVYNQDGQYDLGLRYAQMLTEESPGPAGVCKGGQMRMEALMKSSKVTEVTPEFDTVIDACNKSGELLRANLVRTYIAKIYLANNRPEAAIKILIDHQDEVRKAQYPNLISEYEALLAQAYRAVGDSPKARQFAQRAVESGVKNEYTEALMIAYRILYLLAKEQGDLRSALGYHEKYLNADKGYLDDLSARQLAYQRAKHEVDANRLQIEALNKQNEVLKLQRQLSNKALENVRLYIILSTVVLGFILLWAYKTKRSQLHFMKLSRQDSLTGIFNRPHFIEQASAALLSAEKSGQQICIAICDLDHFKAINDNWGHATGDDVLRQASIRFTTTISKYDLVGRLGGEEFGILLTDCDLPMARQRCEQIRIALAEIVITQQGAESRLSASFGIAGTSTSGHDFRQLLAHADSALYRAKRGGRNRIVLHGEEIPRGPDYDDADDRLSA